MLQFIEIILLLIIGWLVLAQRPGGVRSLLGRQKRIIVDSCALIDGRIIEIVKSGFIADQITIPQFIVNELQLLADGSDSHKRERARFGLDIVRELQDIAPTQVSIDHNMIPAIPTNDDKLIVLAKKRYAQLYTTDYNLAKVASIEGVSVLNVNELAQSLRPATLPGEVLNIKILQRGTNRDQGVGYLDDGTMIVVDAAAHLVGKTVPVTVTRMHQTVAGKMVFGHAKDANSAKVERTPREERKLSTKTPYRLLNRSGKKPMALLLPEPGFCGHHELVSHLNSDSVLKMSRERTVSNHSQLDQSSGRYHRYYHRYRYCCFESYCW
ncbi:MAG TPA: TRAM domain-containing protein [Candidatus Saccharimonadales bacterium]|nr:TRAM domain-containing protein [Candidatus Saccharimonadales bacterium]